MKWIHDNENCCSINVLNITTVWPSKVLWWPISWLPFVQEVTCIHQAPNHYLNQCLLIITGILWYSFVGIFTDNIWIISQQNVFKFYTFEIGHISPRVHWVNPLRLNNSIWIHRSGQTLTQVMACCLVAPSHYLHQCWLIISEVSTWEQFPSYSSVYYESENFIFKITATSPRGQWVNDGLTAGMGLGW